MNNTEYKLSSSLTVELYSEEMKNLNLLQINKFSKQQNKSHWAVDGGYGLIQIYYEYVSLNYEKIKPVVNCLHGFFPGMNDSWIKKSEASFKSIPVTFLHNDSHLKEFMYFFGKHKKFILLANPYHYILDNYSSFTIEKEKRNGAVVFLPHSIGQKSNLTYNIDRILEYVKINYLDFSPITFCIHPNDINSFFVEKIKNYGFNVACNGGRHDPKFLHRFFWLTHNKKYALMFDVSSHLELAVLSKLEIIRIPYNIIYYLPINGGTNDITEPKDVYWTIYEQFYSGKINQGVLSNAVALTTGEKYFKDSDKLKKILLETEMFYKNSINITNNNYYPYKIFHMIEPYFLLYKKYLNAIGLRLSNLRNQQTIFFSDTFYKLIENKKNNS